MEKTLDITLSDLRKEIAKNIYEAGLESKNYDGLNCLLPVWKVLAIVEGKE